MKVLAGLVLSGSSEGEDSSTFWWLLAILGASWLWDQLLRSLPLPSHQFVLCAFLLSFPSLSWHWSSDLGVTQVIQGSLILRSVLVCIAITKYHRLVIHHYQKFVSHSS